MNTFSTNLQNIINLFTHVKNIHVVFNSNASLILLIVLSVMIYVIGAEVKIYKVKKSTLWITLFIYLVIMIGCVFIFNQSAINWMNQNLPTGLCIFTLLFSWFSMPSLMAWTKDDFMDNWGSIAVFGVMFVLPMTFIVWLFGPADKSANASAILAFAHIIAI